MNPFVSYLLTFISRQELVHVAIKFDHNLVSRDAIEYYRELEYSDFWRKMARMDNLSVLVEMRQIEEIIDWREKEMPEGGK